MQVVAIVTKSSCALDRPCSLKKAVIFGVDKLFMVSGSG